MGLLNFLPEDETKKQAARQGLLSLGAAMLQGRGNFGNVLGQGLAAGANGYQGSIQQTQRDQLEAAQLKLMQGKDAREQRNQSMIASAFGGGANQPSGGPIAQSGAGGPMPQGGSAPRAGQFPLSLNQVAQFKLMGLGDLSPEYKMANEGFKREQGASYDMPDGSRKTFARLDNGQMQGDDGSVTSAPGYNEALAATEAAKAQAIERAKAGFDLLPPSYVGEDGRPIGGTRAGYIAKLGELPRTGGAPQPPRQAPRPGAPVTTANFPRVSSQEQAQRDGGRLEILQAELAKATDPNDIAMLKREIAGTRGAPRLQSAVEAKEQIGAVETTQKAGQELNSNWIKEVQNPVQMAGKEAKTTLNQLETVRNIGLKTGWGAVAKAEAASFLSSLGVTSAEKYATNVQQFQQVAMEKNLFTLQAQSGPQTEGDSQRAQQTWMQLKNTPKANAYIADLAGANARISAMKADYYNNALPLARKNGDFTEIDRRWSKISPSVWSDPALAKYKAK